MSTPAPQAGNPASICQRCEELEAALRYLAMAWDNLCECVDEFEPEDMTACAAHRDALDSAILRAIRFVEPYR